MTQVHSDLLQIIAPIGPTGASSGSINFAEDRARAVFLRSNE